MRFRGRVLLLALLGADVTLAATTTTTTTSAASTSTDSTSTSTSTSTTSTSSTVTSTSSSSTSTSTTSTSISTSSSSSSTTEATTSSSSSTLQPATTTLPPSGCNLPDGATFTSVLCRIDALIERLIGASALDRLEPKLAKSLAKARIRIVQAETVCSDGDPRKTKKRLHQAAKALSRYVHRLDARSASKQLDDQLRRRFLQAGEAIAPDVDALGAQCPPA